MAGENGWKKILVVSIFLLPSMLGFVVFTGFPIISSFFISFTEWDLISSPKFIGFDNYINLFNDQAFWEALKHSLLFIAGYLPTVMVISLGIALMINQKIKFKAFYRSAYFAPVVTSWVAVSLIWKWLLNPTYGLVNYFLSWFGIQGPAWLQDPNWAMVGIIITSVWKDIGFVMILFLAGLQGISETYYEAADIDGASSIKKFWYITLPLLAPTTFFVFVISLINSFQVFDQVMIMTEGGPAGSTTVMVQLIYNHAFRYFEMGYASALSWVLFIIIFIITAIQLKLQKRWADYGQ